MHIEYDPIKNQKNIEYRGLPFAMAVDFDFTTALIWQDTRKPYPETRYSSLGLIDNRLYALVFCEVDLGIRIISFRKANQRECKKYDQFSHQTQRP